MEAILRFGPDPLQPVVLADSVRAPVPVPRDSVSGPIFPRVPSLSRVDQTAVTRVLVNWPDGHPPDFGSIVPLAAEPLPAEHPAWVFATPAGMTVVCGVWCIPSSRLQSCQLPHGGERASRAVLTVGRRWDECSVRLETQPLATTNGWLHAAGWGWDRRRYWVRDRSSAWWEWARLSFRDRTFRRLEQGASVAGELRFVQDVPYVHDLAGPGPGPATGDWHGDVDFDSREGGVLTVGAIHLFTPRALEKRLLEAMRPLPASVRHSDDFPTHLFLTRAKQESLAEEILSFPARVRLGDDFLRCWIELPNGMKEVVDKNVASIPTARGAVETAVYSLVDWMGDDTGAAMPTAQLRDALSDSGQKLFDALIVQMRSCALRSVALSEIIALCESHLAAGSEHTNWDAAFGLVYLHLLSGCARPRQDPNPDVVLQALLAISETSSGARRHSVTNHFAHKFAEHLWDAVISLGEMGFRLHSCDLRKGHALLQIQHHDQGRSGRLRLVLVYGAGDHAIRSVMATVADRGAKTPCAVLLCTEDPNNPDARLLGEDLKIVSLVYGASFAATPADAGHLEPLVTEAREAMKQVRNPVRIQPEDARPSRTARAEFGDLLSAPLFIPREKVVANLEISLGGASNIVGIWCMRKAGKTATARLLAASLRQSAHFVVAPERFLACDKNVARFWEPISVAQPPLLVAGKGAAPARPLLILDEFDTLCRTLGSGSEEDAYAFLIRLDAFRSGGRVICLGFDPLALRMLYPASNPLQDIPTFRLPYFSEDVARMYIERTLGSLRVTAAAVAAITYLSGGHPGTMLKLCDIAVCHALGVEQTPLGVPRDTQVDFPDALMTRMLSGARSQFRERALSQVLPSRAALGGAVPIAVAEGWRAAAALSILDETTSRAEAEIATTNIGAGSGRDGAAVIEQLLDWGLLKARSDGSLTAGIPLLRTHLRLEAGYPT